MTRFEVALGAILIALLLAGPAAHSWFEWRVSRDVADTQASIEHRLAVVEQFVDSRRAVAPADVLAWLKGHSVPCTCATPEPRQ